MGESIGYTWVNLQEQKDLREEGVFELMSEGVMCVKSPLSF